MFKGRLVLETVGEEAIDREIEITEGEGLIFRVNGSRFSDMEGTIKAIQKFLNGEEKFMVISGSDIQIIKLTTKAKPEATDEPGN